jgi:hypothetical protein
MAGPPCEAVDDREQRFRGRQERFLKTVAGDQAVEVVDGGVLVRVEGGRSGQADQQPDGDGQPGPQQQPPPGGERGEAIGTCRAPGRPGAGAASWVSWPGWAG